MINYCMYCGTKIEEMQNFCKNCGKEIVRKPITREEQMKNQGKQVAEQIIKLQNGKLQAFDQLYSLTKKYIYYCILQSGVSEDAVQDVMQETYITIYNKIGDLHNPDSGLGWMKQIAFHKGTDYFRKSSREKLSIADENSELKSEEEIDKFPMPEDIMENKETQRLLSEIIANLSDDERKIITAYYYNESKVHDIAEMYDIPANTVKIKLFRARNKIKVEVEELEKKHGIRLHTLVIAPVLCMLFHTQAEASEVPASMSNMVKSEIEQRINAEVLKTNHAVNNVGEKSKIANTRKNIVKASGKHARKMAIKKVFIILITTGVVAGSSIGVYLHFFSSTPEKTIEKFEQAYNELDIEAMVDCLDETTQNGYGKLEIITNFLGVSPQDLLDGIIAIGKDISGENVPKIDIEVVNIQYTDKENAKATCTLKYDDQSENIELSLVKEENVWHLEFNEL